MQATATAKLFYVDYRHGSRQRYWLRFHDGIKTHRDGSPFFDVKTFTNKPALAEHIKGLNRQGYTER